MIENQLGWQLLESGLKTIGRNIGANHEKIQTFYRSQLQNPFTKRMLQNWGKYTSRCYHKMDNLFLILNKKKRALALLESFLKSLPHFKLSLPHFEHFTIFGSTEAVFYIPAM
jgi:hypothetical protein